MTRRAAVVVLLAVAACRTVRPPGATPISPLETTSPAAAAQQLAFRRTQFRGQRSLIRIRMPVGDAMRSARGQLQVDDSLRMLLTVYTPIGTTAARIYAQRDEVTFLNDIESTAWQGKAVDFVTNFGLFGTELPPSSVALLLIGLPPPSIETIEYSATGMHRVRYGDYIVTYDPPVYPPQRVIFERGGRRMEVEHLESYVDSEPLRPLTIPRHYRCCVLPQL